MDPRHLSRAQKLVMAARRFHQLKQKALHEQWEALRPPGSPPVVWLPESRRRH